MSTIKTGHSALVRSATPTAPTILPTVNLAASHVASPATSPANT